MVLRFLLFGIDIYFIYFFGAERAFLLFRTAFFQTMLFDSYMGLHYRISEKDIV